MITKEMVYKLRESTGAGLMDCKKALNEAQGDFDEAIKILKSHRGLSVLITPHHQE